MAIVSKTVRQTSGVTRTARVTAANNVQLARDATSPALLMVTVDRCATQASATSVAQLDKIVTRLAKQQAFASRYVFFQVSSQRDNISGEGRLANRAFNIPWGPIGNRLHRVDMFSVGTRHYHP